MYRKKILFITSKLIVGGVERSLFNLLKFIDKQNYDLTLLVTLPNGVWQGNIVEGVSVVPLSIYMEKNSVQNKEKIVLTELLTRTYARLMTHFFHDHCRNTYWAVKSWPDFKEQFDCVISYKADDPMVASLASKFQSKKKILWIHGELSKIASDRKYYQKIAKTFNSLFCVSNASASYVKEYFQGYTGQILPIGNIIDKENIVTKSLLKPDVLFRNCSIVTVGRLSYEKGQAMIPKTTRLLLDAGYNIYWYLVGDGSLRETVEAEIQKYDVSDHVILLGTQTNPYPYIKNCDIYVQPSFSEGYCTTTMEAKILRKPIVTTDAPGMQEQFVSGENGLIVDEMTPEALFEGIRTLLDHPELQQKFIENLSHEVCDNSGELQKLYDFIES